MILPPQKNIRRGELSEEQWNRIAPLLPPQKPDTGCPAKDHRMIINGILWILRTGAPWHDLPERYGKRSTVSTRFYRWKQQGVWDRIYDAVKAHADAAGEMDWELHHVDATVVRAHQHAAGARSQPSAADEKGGS